MCAWWFVFERGQDQTSVVLSSLPERSCFFLLSLSFFECGSSSIYSGVVDVGSISLVVLMLGSTLCWCVPGEILRVCVIVGGLLGTWFRGGLIGVALWFTICLCC